jgi:hypothetical protein
VDLLRTQKASVEEELSAARGAVTRINAEVEARGAAAAALTARAEAGAYTRSTFRLHVSAFCGIGVVQGVFRGSSGVFTGCHGVVGGGQNVFCVRIGSG